MGPGGIAGWTSKRLHRTTVSFSDQHVRTTSVAEDELCGIVGKLVAERNLTCMPRSSADKSYFATEGAYGLPLNARAQREALERAAAAVAFDAGMVQVFKQKFGKGYVVVASAYDQQAGRKIHFQIVEPAVARRRAVREYGLQVMAGD